MKKTLFIVVGALALIASALMYFIGKDSSHLSELYDVFWIPLPLGVLSLGLGLMQKKN